MRFDPLATFLVVFAIGAVLGFAFHRFLGRGWISRHVASGRHDLVTSALVGVAGGFIGYHVAALMRLGAGWPQLAGAAVGALAILWIWRAIR